MAQGLNWLHLSDLHLRAGDQYDQSVVLSSLLTDIETLRAEGSAEIDLVYITGDLAFSGRHDEYAIAADFIQRLSDVCEIPLDHVFCVPGNHDVDRSRLTPFLVEATRALSNRELVSNVIGTADEVALFNGRLTNYYSFVKSFFPWAKSFSNSQLAFTQNISVNGIRLSIIGLNSAWLSGSDEDRGRVIVGERQVRDALAETDGTDVLVALLHHPLSHLAEFDASDVQGLLDRRCDFVLHGHIHDFGAVRLTSPDSEVFYLAAGATYQGRRELLSYNIVNLDQDSGQARVSLRRYSDRHGGFWSPDTQMYRSAASGILNFALPERLTHLAQTVDLGSLSERIESFVPESQREVVAVEPKPQIPPPPETLLDCIGNGQCVVFVGAGASIDAKLPTWYELIQDLIEQVEQAGAMMPNEEEEVKSLLEKGDLLILAAYCRERLGPFDFTEYLKRRLTDSGRTSRTHRLLSSIPFRAAVTTNFDTFIEHSRDRARVVLPDMMQKLGGPGVENLLQDSTVFPVVKMHGSVEDPESIVLTRKDFRETLFSKPKYREFLRRLFTDSTIFFYGYSFTDPNVDFVLQEVMAMYDGMARPHYALLPDIGTIARKYWMADFNIRTITYPIWSGSHVAATSFLETMAQAFAAS
jgi:3',5'-cyclic AMP phosphodiesterase CpdA